VGISDKHNARSNLPEEPPTKFRFSTWAMNFVERENGERIVERMLSFRKGYSVFSKVGGFLPGGPRQTSSKDGNIELLKSNIIIKISANETSRV
jgi:hypothetical protein